MLQIIQPTRRKSRVTTRPGPFVTVASIGGSGFPTHNAPSWLGTGEGTDPVTLAPGLDPIVAGSDATAPHVLLMEFDRSHRQILCALLEELGTTVEVAESPAVAFEFLNAGGFDLILIDVGLPMPQVLDSARRIRELPEPTSDIPVIGFTAHLVEFSLDECLEAGMDDLLLGPARKHHVHAALATWLPGAFGGQSRVSRILPRLG